MATQVFPLGDRIIVKPKAAEEVTSFGLVLSDANKEKPMQGEIVAVSKTIKDSSVKKGDIVLYKKYSPTEFNIKNDQGKDEELLVLDLEDVLAKIEK